MPAGTALARPASPRLLSYSTCIAAVVAGPPQRGLVHSVFQAAANIVFPGGFLLSLNTATSPRMPNGIQLPTPPGTMPLAQLRVGMPILLGAQRLCIQSLDYTLDLSPAMQWNPFIERPATLDMDVVRKNLAWLEQYVLKENGQAQRQCASNEETDGRPQPFQPCTGEDGRPQGAPPRDHTAPVPTMYGHGHDWCKEHACLMGEPDGRPSSNVVEVARALCGCGVGLTPTGDDMLAGWMAIGWLLNGPQADFLAACQQIVTIARQQTHLLSQCWLEYAANGYVAEPVGTLLHALTQENEQPLVQPTQAVMAMGATSGHDLIQGILMAANNL